MADTATAPPDTIEIERRPGPIDPRLWRYSATARGYLVLTVVMSLVDVMMVLVAATMIGRVLAGVITTDVRSVGSWITELSVLAAAMVVRVAATWLHARYAHRSASRIVAELELEVLDAAAALPPRELDPRRNEIVTVLTRGLDGLRAYLTGYVPALFLALTLTPITIIVIAFHDLTSALIVIVTLPLIPVFMILIGLLTKGKSDRSLDAMTALSSQVLDLLAGLPTFAHSDARRDRRSVCAHSARPTARPRCRRCAWHSSPGRCSNSLRHCRLRWWPSVSVCVSSTAVCRWRRALSR